jgi:hypothetical protein
MRESSNCGRAPNSCVKFAERYEYCPKFARLKQLEQAVTLLSLRGIHIRSRAFRMRGISTQSQPAARSRFAIGLAVAIIERTARRLDLIIFLRGHSFARGRYMCLQRASPSTVDASNRMATKPRDVRDEAKSRRPSKPRAWKLRRRLPIMAVRPPLGSSLGAWLQGCRSPFPDSQHSHTAP